VHGERALRPGECVRVQRIDDLTLGVAVEGASP
jgi:hypothetical protein